MKSYVSFSGLFVAMLLTLPGLTQAYNPTNQTASTIAETIVVFSMETTINAADDSLKIPVFGSMNDKTNTFGYELFSDTSAVNIAGAFGVIIADASIVDGQYELVANRPTKFTILILAVPAANAERQQLRARLTSLPLGVDNALNQYELANYQTPKTTI